MYLTKIYSYKMEINLNIVEACCEGIGNSAVFVAPTGPAFF